MRGVLWAVALVVGFGLGVQTCCGPTRADQVDDAMERLCPGKHGYAPHVREAQQRYAIPPRLLVALMWVESRCNHKACSGKGAVGLMQLLGPARNGLRGDALLDPRNNILAGARWLAIRIQKCGTVEQGIGAYNTGSCHAGRRFARWVLATAKR